MVSVVISAFMLLWHCATVTKVGPNLAGLVLSAFAHGGTRRNGTLGLATAHDRLPYAAEAARQRHPRKLDACRAMVLRLERQPKIFDRLQDSSIAGPGKYKIFDGQNLANVAC